MKIKNKKSGFTLLEIIIVIIIVGVLASLALPRFFETIEFSRSAEAINYLGTIKRGMEQCALMSGAANWPACDTIATTGQNSAPQNGHFTYSLNTTGMGAASTGTVSIIAQRTSLNSGNTNDNITFTLNYGTSVLTREGSSAFVRIN